ncbi:type II toxin-antitoxin system RelE/ParE family toxin [uncultured Desulfobacter sp.]|uniref:type II toxin-antitoxin system RelE family toxin n=1 Tax=uncultured Desulfobacter sp. TaxID=240139 RepID=UPI002D1E4A00|nr:type II toxin-antitoxin system RelE/ParE family toxin [uncultured Desulfobacter sp.]
MKQIKWRKKALRQLRKIKNITTRSAIKNAVGSLTDFPNCQNVKRLVNHPFDYRLRIGNWRVLFTESLEIINIEEVKKRNERTY